MALYLHCFSYNSISCFGRDAKLFVRIARYNDPIDNHTKYKWILIMIKDGYMYILSNSRRTVLYTGSATDLCFRIWQHKNGEGAVFTRKYNATDLMFYEYHEHIKYAYRREQQIKRWRRDWKWDLIKSMNPEMKDLYPELCT